MSHAVRFAIPLLGLTLCAANLRAAAIPIGGGVTVSCLMSDGSACTPIGALSWAIAEPANDTTVEPGIALTFNVPFSATGAFNILDPALPTGAPCPTTTPYPLACVSDQVSFFNFTQNNGNGVLDFFSDPNPNITGNDPSSIPIGCIESVVAGCSFTFGVTTAALNFNVTLFSDGDFPSGGSVTSDTLSITPEPSPGMLLGVALGAVLLIRLASTRKVKSRPDSFSK